jgi:hypothetical protein
MRAAIQRPSRPERQQGRRTDHRRGLGDRAGGGNGNGFSGLSKLLTIIFFLATLIPNAHASLGDQLPEFQECLKICESKNCDYFNPVPVQLHLRLLFWTCKSECDYACQHSVTQERIRDGEPVEQFHGKWPFRRLLGIQEPLSVLFSLMNLYGHLRGLKSLRRNLPHAYPLARFYRCFAYIGIICWTCSAIFHTRDFILTERLDYFGAGANVLYGLYYCPVRIFRLYRPRHGKILKLWSYACLSAYFAHVYYLQFIEWSYTYNMAANIVVGSLTNVLWIAFSVYRYRRLRRVWTMWPAMVVAWLIFAMSLELLDFAPLLDALDAHALWHAATVIPVIWWYRFLVMDARMDVEYLSDIGAARIKN